jgi:hypothetical protein
VLNRSIALARWLYNHLGDPRSKNVLIFILIAMSGFGIVAPATATSLRDMVLSMISTAS